VRGRDNVIDTKAVQNKKNKHRLTTKLMKTIVTTCIALLAFATALAQEKVVKEMDMTLVNKSAVPGPLVQKAEKDFPGASPFNYYLVGDTTLSRDWKITESVDFQGVDKVDYYKVDMRGKNANFEALYDAKGKLIMSKQEEKNIALPSAVLNSWAKSEYKNSPLVKDKHVKVIDHGKKTEYYVVTLQNGKKLTYSAKGDLIKK
jgi:hypothetical protein